VNSEELHNLYPPPNIIRVINQGRCSTHRTDEKYVQNFGRKTRRQATTGRARRRERIILECMLKKWDWRVRTGLIRLKIETSGGSL